MYVQHLCPCLRPGPPSLRPSVIVFCMSIRVSRSPSVIVFRTLLLHALTYWAEYLYVTFVICPFDQVRVSSISVNFCFDGIMPLSELRILEIHSFPQSSLTCFDILSWKIAYGFVLLYYKSSSSVFNFCSYYGMVMSVWVVVHPTLHPFVRVSVHPFSVLFS